MKVKDETIKKYCQRMNYKLISIGKIAFRYEKPDGSEAALLKSAACYIPLNKHIKYTWFTRRKDAR